MSRVAEALSYEPPPRNPQLMPEGVPLDVCVMFEGYALQAIAAGVTRYSADAILHRIRWHHQIERGNREFVANNNWTAPLARWFNAKHPEMKGFFETRKLKEERDAV